MKSRRGWESPTLSTHPLDPTNMKDEIFPTICAFLVPLFIAFIFCL